MVTVTAMDEALATIEANMQTFATLYPHHNTENNRYPFKDEEAGEPLGGNTSWTTGFWPGMLWLAHDLTGDERFHQAASYHVASFVERADRDVDLDHHDMGFLYTPTCTTAWRADRDAEARRAALIAADHLMARVLEPAGIIQAWGNLGDPEQQGRAIIDSLMNMPLLYWATATTGDQRYAGAAVRHSLQLAERIIRPDGTTFHTFYWDTTTGEPRFGRTHQGYTDDSCWARGQAWGIYGFLLNHLNSGEQVFLDCSIRCADRFLQGLPRDRVPFWDMSFTDGSEHPRDSSAAAIAVCGLFQLAKVTGEQRYQDAADEILDSLITIYTPRPGEDATCLLKHGVYHWHGGLGVDEGNLWGDYYFLEALTLRARPDWQSYWLPSPKDAIA